MSLGKILGCTNTTFFPAKHQYLNTDFLQFFDVIFNSCSIQFMFSNCFFPFVKYLLMSFLSGIMLWCHDPRLFLKHLKHGYVYWLMVRYSGSSYMNFIPRAHFCFDEELFSNGVCDELKSGNLITRLQCTQKVYMILSWRWLIIKSYGLGKSWLLLPTVGCIWMFSLTFIAMLVGYCWNAVV